MCLDTLTADTLAASLQESKKALLAKVLRTLGQERCQALWSGWRVIYSIRAVALPPPLLYTVLVKCRCAIARSPVPIPPGPLVISERSTYRAAVKISAEH